MVKEALAGSDEVRGWIGWLVSVDPTRRIAVSGTFGHIPGHMGTQLQSVLYIPMNSRFASGFYERRTGRDAARNRGTAV